MNPGPKPSYRPARLMAVHLLRMELTFFVVLLLVNSESVMQRRKYYDIDYALRNVLA